MTKELATTGKKALDPLRQAAVITERTKWLDKKIQPTLAKLAALGITGRRLEHMVALFHTNGPGSHQAVFFPLQSIIKNNGSASLQYAATSADAFDHLLQYAQEITAIRQSFYEYGYAISYRAASEIHSELGERGIDMLDDLIDQCMRLDGRDDAKLVMARFQHLLEDSRRCSHPTDRLLRMRMELYPDEDVIDRMNMKLYWKDHYGTTRPDWAIWNGRE